MRKLDREIRVLARMPTTALVLGETGAEPIFDGLDAHLGLVDTKVLDGRLVLLEYRAEDPNVPIIAEHKMTVGQVKAELEAEGFVLQPVIETLPRQHLLIHTRAAAKAARQ